MNIKKVPVAYYFRDLVHDPRQRGHLKCNRISVESISVRIWKKFQLIITLATWCMILHNCVIENALFVVFITFNIWI